MRGGVIALGLTLIAAVMLVVLEAPRVSRLLIALPAAAAAIGFFQAQAQTCVALAKLGVRNMDDGNSAVTDAAELQAMRAQSQQVYLKTLIAAIVAAAILYVL